jgi:hypothetical protein
MKPHIYHIEFAADGETAELRHETVRARSPGQAQFFFHQRFPGYRILKQWTEARAGGACLGTINYEPVSTTRIEPLPEIKTEEQTFPFFDECRSTKPL